MTVLAESGFAVPAAGGVVTTGLATGAGTVAGACFAADPLSTGRKEILSPALNDMDATGTQTQDFDDRSFTIIAGTCLSP